MIDCGLFQGLKELRARNWEPLPFDPASVASIVLTLTVAGAARRGTLGSLHRALAVISMLLWSGIIIAGRYIAYT